MEETTNEKVFTKKTWLNALKLFGKIVFAVVFVLFYIISSMFFILPKFDAKIFNFFGAKKAQEACYVRIYENSGSNADLYNLILFESDLENYEKELYYLNLLMNSEDYENFYLKLDESAFNAVEDASLIVYLCNTNSYLINQKVKCMYNLGFDAGVSATVRNYVKFQLTNNNYRFETSFATYIDLIYNDATLSKAEKQQKANTAYDALESLVQSRLVFLTNYNTALNITVKDNIISQHTIVELKKALYIIDVINETDSASSKKAYEDAVTEYNRLLNNVYYD